jgi:hypothetical protein
MVGGVGRGDGLDVVVVVADVVVAETVEMTDGAEGVVGRRSADG